MNIGKTTAEQMVEIQQEHGIAVMNVSLFIYCYGRTLEHKNPIF